LKILYWHALFAPTDTERVAAMGRRARAMLEAHFMRRQAFEPADI
jgi:hypothetical protein